MNIAINDLDAQIKQIDLRAGVEKFELGDFEIYRGDINVHIDINKIGSEIFVKAAISGDAFFTCDRCLKQYKRTLSENVLWVYTSQKELLEGDQEDVYYIDPDDVEIDITQPTREMLIVMLPVKTLCSENCKGLCPHCGADLNIAQCSCSIEISDPRWAALEKLKNKP